MYLPLLWGKKKISCFPRNVIAPGKLPVEFLSSDFVKAEKVTL